MTRHDSPLSPVKTPEGMRPVIGSRNQPLAGGVAQSPSPAKTPGGCETCDREQEPNPSLAGGGTQSCVSQEKGESEEECPQSWSLLALRAQAEWAMQWAHGER